MINQVGAYIFTVLVIGVFFRRPSPSRFEENMCKAPLYLHLMVTALLSLVVLDKLVVAVPYLSLVTLIPDTIILWAHEAGHVYWSFGGTFMNFLGGTLNEVLIPLGLGFYFSSKRYLFLTLFSVFLFAYNCIGISIYMADARKQVLPLLGGNHNSRHDWNYILTQINLLDWDTTLASFVQGIGAVLMIATIVFYARYAISLSKTNDENESNFL